MKRLVILLVFIMFVTACSNSGNEGNSGKEGNSEKGNGESQTQGKDAGASQSETNRWDPLAKFDEPVVLNIAKSINTSQVSFPNGDTLEKNKILDYLEKNTNIKVNYSWHVETPDAYNQKLGISIASRDLPDAFLVNESQLKTLVKADLIADLSEVIDKTLAKSTKDKYESFGDRVLNRVTFNGKIMAIPNTQYAGRDYAFLWIRQDWLDALGLQPPQTVDELITVAKAFIEQDPDGNKQKDTYGILGNPGSLSYGFDPILAAFDAYQGKWLEDASGNIVYSSTLPEMKTALTKLREMYKDGIIDPEFAVNPDPTKHIAANKVGLVFGPWSIPYYWLNNSVKNDPKAEWKPYALPLDAKGQFNVADENPTNSFLVVRKGYEHPEAVAKLLNWNSRNDLAQEETNFYKAEGISMSQIMDYWPFRLDVNWEDELSQGYQKFMTAIETENTDQLSNEIKGWYNSYMKNLENPKKDINYYAEVLARTEGMKVISDKNLSITRNVFFGQTATMERKGAILNKLETETFLKIILGREPIDKFDAFVADWKRLGGDEIIADIKQEIGK